MGGLHDVAGLAPLDLVAIAAAGAAAFVAVLSIGAFVASERRNVARRIAAAGGNVRMRAAARPGERRPFGDWLRNVVERLDLLQGEAARRVTDDLARAGWRTRQALVRFFAAKLFLPIGAAAVTVLVLFGLDFGNLPPLVRIAAALVAVLGASYGPNLYVKNHADKRREKLRKALPDALDLLVICAEAGLSMDAAFARVAGEIAPNSPELADEIRQTSAELRYQPDRRLALENLSRRVDLPAVQALTNTLIQTEKYGTPLANALRVLSAEQRDDRMMRAEEKGARLPAIMTIPLVLFIMPALFIVLLGPAALSIVDTFSTR